MIQVFETIFNADGEMLKRDPIVLVFSDRDTAALFLQTHLGKSFADGRSGYHESDDYWWGCNDGPDLQIYRYTIEQ